MYYAVQPTFFVLNLEGTKPLIKIQSDFLRLCRKADYKFSTSIHNSTQSTLIVPVEKKSFAPNNRMRFSIVSLLLAGLVVAVTIAEPQYFNPYYGANPFYQQAPGQGRLFFPLTAFTITYSTATATTTTTSTTTCTTSTAALSTCTAGRRRRGALLPDEDWLQGEKIAPSAVERSVLDFLR